MIIDFLKVKKKVLISWEIKGKGELAMGAGSPLNICTSVTNIWPAASQGWIVFSSHLYG